MNNVTKIHAPLVNEVIDLSQATITKICPACGKHFTISAAKKRGREQKYCCYRCGTDYHCKHVRTKDSQRQRVSEYYLEYPELRFLASTKQIAKEKGLAFDLDAVWFKERLARGICEVTGLPIKVKQYTKGKRGDRGFFSPSIDRIDNNAGYIPSNCRLVCWGYNLSKNQFTDREVYALSVAILIRHIPKSSQKAFLKSLPEILVASLPPGHTLF
jgi:predicted RNA-binding Zn-ribbon protein involved in translation (DUF1610 family)